MVEAIYEHSLDYLEELLKKIQFFILNHEPFFSGFASITSFAVSSYVNNLIFAINRLTTKTLLCASRIHERNY